jgi:hypothetical protein
MRIGLLLVGAAAVASCAPAPPMARTAEAQSHLDHLLTGRVAGPAQSCLSQFRAEDMITIDENTVLFKVGSTYYRNDFRGNGCSNLGRPGSAMVTKSPVGTRFCSGEIVTINDTVSGMLLGTCLFGEFVPYRKA